MSRPRTGTLIRKRTARGISYAVRFRIGDEKIYHPIGGSWEGWDDETAEAEQRRIMLLVNRGAYVPPAAPVRPVLPTPAPTFQLAASAWLHRQKIKASDPGGESPTIKDLVWRLGVVMDDFAHVPVDQLGYGHADDLVTRLVRERLAIAAAVEQGAPLIESYVDPRTGRTHERRRRGLSNGSIHKALDAAERVLRDLKERGELAGDVPSLKRAVGRKERPRRSFLEVHQIVACQRAAELIEESHRGLTWEKVAYIRSSPKSNVALARELRVSDVLVSKVRRRLIWVDRAERRNRNDIPRRVVFDTLVLAGPRISELCGLDGHHVDIANGRIRIPREVTKTDAGERVVPMVPALRERLVEHRMDVAGGSATPAFPNRNGGRQRPDNVRSRILEAIRVKANELLEAEGLMPIEHLTPHSLRRTFASILAVCNVPPRRAMYLLGHTDPKFTMRVYQQVLDVPEVAVEQLEEVLGCSLDEACAVFLGRAEWTPNGHSTTKKASGAERLSEREA